MTRLHLVNLRMRLIHKSVNRHTVKLNIITSCEHFLPNLFHSLFSHLYFSRKFSMCSWGSFLQILIKNPSVISCVVIPIQKSVRSQLSCSVTNLSFHLPLISPVTHLSEQGNSVLHPTLWTPASSCGLWIIRFYLKRKLTPAPSPSTDSLLSSSSGVTIKLS